MQKSCISKTNKEHGTNCRWVFENIAIHTHTHTHIFIIIQANPFDFGLLSQMVQTSWVFSCSWTLLMIEWKCCFLDMHHKHMAQTVCLYLEMTRLLLVSMREGGPKRWWWCLVCPFQQCRLLALLTHGSVCEVCKWRYHTNH